MPPGLLDRVMHRTEQLMPHAGRAEFAPGFKVQLQRQTPAHLIELAAGHPPLRRQLQGKGEEIFRIHPPMLPSPPPQPSTLMAPGAAARFPLEEGFGEPWFPEPNLTRAAALLKMPIFPLTRSKQRGVLVF